MTIDIEGDFVGKQLKILSRAALTAIRSGHECTRTSEGGESAAVKFASYLGDIQQSRLPFPDAAGRRVAEDRAEFAFSWVIHGMPRLVVEPKLAASFAATTIPEEFANTIEAPWKFFVATIPHRILDEDEHTVLVRRVWVHGDEIGEYNGTNWKLPRGADGGRLAGARILASYHMPGQQGIVAPIVACAPWSEFASPELPTDGRIHDDCRAVTETVMRFVFGCVMELQGNESAARAVAALPRGLPREKRGEPRSYAVKLTRSVRVDVRAAIREYCKGNGSSPKVQGIVRGHWKRQRSGPGGSERTFIHIEPYWRGPEDAPIAVRSHILKGLKNENDGGTRAAE